MQLLTAYLAGRSQNYETYQGRWLAEAVGDERATIRRSRQNDAKVRAEICGGLHWMGIVLDEVRNRAVTNPISDPTSRCAVGTLVANRLTRVDAAEG